MSYLTINGVEVPVSIPAGNGRQPVIAGERTRALSGMPRSSIRASRFEWTRATTPQTKATAEAFRKLIDGEGYHWAFDSHIYDGKGLGPSTATGATATATGVGPKYGAGYLLLSATGTLQYPIVGSATAWALSYWKLNNPVDGVWEHFFVLGSGAKYKNGVSTSEATWTSYNGSILRFYPADAIYPGWVDAHAYTVGDYVVAGSGPWVFRAGNTATSSGEPDWDSAPALEDTVGSGDGITWVNYGPADGCFDDVLFLPYTIPTDWVAQLYAEAAARAFTALPRFRMSGSIVNNIAITAEGESGETTDVPAELAGGWESDARVFSFILREV